MGAIDSQPIHAPIERDLSEPYINSNRREILGVRRQHFVLYSLLCRTQAPRELARAIVRCLYNHEMKTVVDDALTHGWVIHDSIGCYYRYLAAPSRFACSGWSHRNFVEVEHPHLGWVVLSDITMNKQLRQTGDIDPPREKTNPNNVRVGSEAMFFI